MFFESPNYDYDVLNLAGFSMMNNQPEVPNIENSEKIVPTKEGFLRGNMWKDEYVPYKGMTYEKLVATNEQEALLFKIMEMEFAVNDLNLYLDLHPEDNAMYEKFKKYTEECIKLKDEYAKRFGPLMLHQTEKNYEWLKNPWPWDKSGGSIYV